MKVTFKGAQAGLFGVVEVGDLAPEVEVLAQDLKPVKIGGKQDKVQIIASVPSIDTGVCATQTRKFNQGAASNELVKLSVVSKDLPFAAKRFCGAEGINNIGVYSDLRGEFGVNYGVVLKDCPLAGLLARTIFVVDKDGVVVYKEIVSEITNEPNYEAIQEIIKKIGACNGHCGVK